MIGEPIRSLRIERVTFGYDPERPLFQDLSIELPVGKNILITGRGGGGQSTLLKLLAVTVQPQRGSFLINGEDTTEMSFEEFLPYRLKIGYTFDSGGLFANRTLAENMILPLLYHKILNISEAEQLAFEFAFEFGFRDELRKRPASVSAGLRKLVSILRAFVLRPEMIVMDDPFTGLDSQSNSKLVKLLRERRESGELKHLFMTSRDEIWPTRIGYEPLIVESGRVRLDQTENQEKAA